VNNSMNGLRVYKNLNASVAAPADLNFYSRRSGGPYYRWRYERLFSRWQWSRLHTIELEEMELVVANWKGLPAELKLSLNEHYVE
jgi:hypothetical protein